jgi:hypothetical protein
VVQKKHLKQKKTGNSRSAAPWPEPVLASENTDDSKSTSGNLFDTYTNKITKDPTSFFKATDELVDEFLRLYKSQHSKKLQQDAAQKIALGLSRHLNSESNKDLNLDEEKLKSFLIITLQKNAKLNTKNNKLIADRLLEFFTNISNMEENKEWIVTLRLISHAFRKTKNFYAQMLIRKNITSIIYNFILNKPLSNSDLEYLHEHIIKKQSETMCINERNKFMLEDMRIPHELSNFILTAFVYYKKVMSLPVIFDIATAIFMDTLYDIPIVFLLKNNQSKGKNFQFLKRHLI